MNIREERAYTSDGHAIEVDKKEEKLHYKLCLLVA